MIDVSLSSYARSPRRLAPMKLQWNSSDLRIQKLPHELDTPQHFVKRTYIKFRLMELATVRATAG
jgi:hypothetical protein